MGVEVIIAMLWKYRMVLVYGAIAGLLYWAFVHNPKVIKRLEAEKRVAIEQREAAFEAINMLQVIGSKHAETEKSYEANLRRIRSSKKPSRTGYWLLGGLLPEVYQTYSSASGSASTDVGGKVRP